MQQESWRPLVSARVAAVLVPGTIWGSNQAWEGNERDESELGWCTLLSLSLAIERNDVLGLGTGFLIGMSRVLDCLGKSARASIW